MVSTKREERLNYGGAGSFRPSSSEGLSSKTRRRAQSGAAIVFVVTLFATLLCATLLTTSGSGSHPRYDRWVLHRAD